MGKNGTTQRKINEIIEMVKSGASTREIIKKKFNGGVKAFNDFLERNKTAFNDFPFLFGVEYQNKMPNTKKTANNELIELSNYKIENLEIENLKNLNSESLGKLLIMFAPELLGMLNEAKHLKKINNFIEEKNNLIKLDDVLVVPAQVLEAKDKRNRTLRLSEKIENEFDDLIKNYKIYSKTDLLNFAILEFIEKYKKN